MHPISLSKIFSYIHVALISYKNTFIFSFNLFEKIIYDFFTFVWQVQNIPYETTQSKIIFSKTLGETYFNKIYTIIREMTQKNASSKNPPSIEFFYQPVVVAARRLIRRVFRSWSRIFFSISASVNVSRKGDLSKEQSHFTMTKLTTKQMNKG